jgi:hypothetical protein
MVCAMSSWSLLIRMGWGVLGNNDSRAKPCCRKHEVARMGRQTVWAMMVAMARATPVSALLVVKSDGAMRDAFLGWLIGYVDGRQYGSTVCVFACGSGP